MGYSSIIAAISAGGRVLICAGLACAASVSADLLSLVKFQELENQAGK